MPEPRRVESLGSSLLDLGQPQPSVWSRYKRDMEGAMTELEKRTRRFERLRWIALGVSGLLIVLGALFFVRFGAESGSVTRELRPMILSIVMFLIAVLFLVQYHVDRINLEIRRDIKELTLAVLELKEGLAKRS
jgi:heme A synthase